MARRSRRPAPLVREDVRTVLARAMRSGQEVVVHVALPGGSLIAGGTVRAIDDRTAELLGATGRTRRVPLRLIESARAVPERVAGARTVERLAEAERW